MNKAARERRAANIDRARAVAAKYRANHPEETKQKQKEWRDSAVGRAYAIEYARIYYANPRSRMIHLTGAAFRRAAKAGLEFDVVLRNSLVDDPPTTCVCCDTLLDYSTRRGNKHELDSRSPSLDRLDNSKGYTVENTRIVCMRCNNVKGSATLAELRDVVAYMERG